MLDDRLTGPMKKFPSDSDHPTSAPDSNLDGVSRALILFVVVMAAALSMSPNVADPDLWGHIQYGRDVLREGKIAETTSYSYTANGYRWINHENLSEIVMALVADRCGPLGLVLGKFLLSLLVIGLALWSNLRRGVGVIATSILVLLLGANLGYHWSIRPQLSSFVGFAVVIALLQFCFQGWQDRWHLPWPAKSKAQLSVDSGQPVFRNRQLLWLWALPIIFLFWTNAHGGFVAGVCVTLAYLGLRILESMIRSSDRNWHRVHRVALISVALVLITLVNPYGPRLQIWLLESLGSPRPEISDWSTTQLTGLVGMKLWALVFVSAIALGFSRKPHDLTQLVLLSLTLWQSLSHFRHVPFFAILAAFWLGPHLESALVRLKISGVATPSMSRTTQWAIRSCLVFALAVIGFRLSQRLSELPVRRDVFPVDAIAFMKQNELNGRTVVTYDWAQYLIAARCTSDSGRVAFDGRFRTCYPQEIVDMYFDFLYGDAETMPRHRSPNSGPIDPERILQHGQPDLVLISRKNGRADEHMKSLSSSWTLLYQDGLAQVWGRKSVFDRPDSPKYVLPEQRIIADEMPTGFQRWPAL